jgi:hypothetical protein
MALGSKLDRQIVTIQPRSMVARGMGYKFVAEAKFMKKTEVLALLDPESLGYKTMCYQQTPPAQVLREIISIERPGHSPVVESARHGEVRFLRLAN